MSAWLTAVSQSTLLEYVVLCMLAAGEAMVVAQALALLGYDAAHVVLAATALAYTNSIDTPFSPGAAAAAPAMTSLRSESSTFVELLSAGCLLAALPLVLLLRGAMRPPRVNWIMLGEWCGR